MLLSRSFSIRSSFAFFRFTCISFFILLSFVTPSHAAWVTLDLAGDYGHELAGYRVHYKTGESGSHYDGTGIDQGDSPITVPIEELEAADSGRITLTGLSENTNYRFVATAYDKTGNESIFSNEVTCTPDAPPSAPRGLTASIPEMGSAPITAELSWNANSEEDMGGYNVYSKDSSGSWVFLTDSGSAASCSIGGIEQAAIYYFTVTAYDRQGNESPYAEQITIDTSHYQVDSDGDGVPDEMDAFQDLADEWLDTDGDGRGDNSDPTPEGDDVASEGPYYGSIPVIEVGQARVNQEWKRVALEKTFYDPVVVPASLSLNGNQPAMARIRNVTAEGFDIRVQEWEYLDGAHAYESVGYIVMERGAYTLPDGSRLEASYFETRRTNAFEPVLFEQAYARPPVVAASITSDNASAAAVSCIRHIGTEGFEYGMQVQEASPQPSASETIAYVAWEPSMGTLDGLAFDIGRTADTVTHDFQSVYFSQPFGGSPVFVSAMQTCDGGDTANIRWKNLTDVGVEVHVAEEQSGDDETVHTTETIGYMAFHDSGRPGENRTMAYQQSGDTHGLVAIEAEAYQANRGTSDHNWLETDGATGFSGSCAMQASPDLGARIHADYETGSPVLQYMVNFVHTGRHYIWLRGYTTGGDNSAHGGLNGAAPYSAANITFETNVGWTWSNNANGGRAFVDVEQPGLQSIEIWMREDGLILDKVLLTTNESYRPSGTGPQESPIDY